MDRFRKSMGAVLLAAGLIGSIGVMPASAATRGGDAADTKRTDFALAASTQMEDSSFESYADQYINVTQ